MSDSTLRTDSLSRRMWVIPANDGEAVEVRRLLEEAGEQLFITGQPWGAEWRNLEPSIHAELSALRRRSPETTIYGVELAGPNPYLAQNIDHHRYGNEDRSHPLSSLEQVAAIIEVALSRRQQLVAANDRGYIPAMRTELEATDEEVAEIRRQDRAAQGITAEHEQQARSDLAKAEWQGDRVLVRCQTNPTTAHSDALFGRARESLLAGKTKWVYYGPRHHELAGLKWDEPSWSGGAEASGYFGIDSPGAEAREKLERVMFSS